MVVVSCVLIITHTLLIDLQIDLAFQTKKIKRVPIILVGTNFWEGLVDWMKSVLIKNKMISKEDLDLFSVVDTQEDVLNCLEKFHIKGVYNPNF